MLDINIHHFKHLFLLFLRHGIISITCGSVEFLSFMLMLSYLHFSLSLSYVISFTIATLIGFVGHSHLTFKVGELRKRNAVFFTIQALSALSIGYVIITMLISAGIIPMYAKMIQLVLIFFFNVSFGKLISFKKQH